MIKLKSNVLFNLIGNSWLGVLTLVVTPVQVRLLGIEAFGFVGLIAILQILLSSLDLGISATVTKVLSSDHSSGKLESIKAVNTASTIYWLTALAIGALVFCLSDTIATDWLTNTSLDTKNVNVGLQLIGTYLCLRWPVAFYMSVISGLQRMDLLNKIKILAQTLRLGGSVIVLMFIPTLTAFLFWYAVSSAIELLLYYAVTRKLLPQLRLTPYFSKQAFSGLWRYSTQMHLIGLTALVLSQADRIAVTKLLSLEALGYYTIAYTAATIVSLIQNAINSASFPAFAFSYSRGAQGELEARYNKASQLMSTVVVLPCCAIIFFGHAILSFWINSDAATAATASMVLLAIGFSLNAVVSNAYIAAISCEQPAIPLKVNVIGIMIYLPGLYAAIAYFGLIGAAASYAGLNLFYLLTLLPIVQSRIIKQSYFKGLQKNLCPFVIVGLIAFGLGKMLLSHFDTTTIPSIVLITGCSVVYLICSYFFLSPDLRQDLMGALKSK